MSDDLRFSPAAINVTGDAGDANAPTYASFATVSNAAGDHRDPDRTGQGVTATLDRSGRSPAEAYAATLEKAFEDALAKQTADAQEKKG